MHEAALVGGVERRGHGHDDALHAVEGRVGPVDELAQVRPGDEAHREIEDAAILAAAVDRNDVRVLERCREPSLRLEAPHGIGVLRVLGRDDLERDGPVEVLVGRSIDDTHPAAIEHALDAIARKDRTGLQNRQATTALIHDAIPGGPLRRPLAAMLWAWEQRSKASGTRPIPAGSCAIRAPRLERQVVERLERCAARFTHPPGYRHDGFETAPGQPLRHPSPRCVRPYCARTADGGERRRTATTNGASPRTPPAGKTAANDLWLGRLQASPEPTRDSLRVKCSRGGVVTPSITVRAGTVA